VKKERSFSIRPSHWILSGVVLLLALALLFTTLSCLAYRKQLETYEGTFSAIDIHKLAEVVSFFDRLSVHDMPGKDELTEQLIQGFIAGMGDRYAAYYNETAYEAWRQSMSGRFRGIGVVVTAAPGVGLEVLQVYRDSPAAAAGVEPGDYIIAVEGESIAELGLNDATDLLRGEVDTEVTFTVQRGSAPPTDLTCLRAEVASETVLWSMLEPDTHPVGYIRITGFDEGTYDQFVEAVDSLEAAGAQGMIFDLRNNGGGSLLSVALVLAYVLPDGPIAYVDYPTDAVPDYSIYANRGSLLYGTTKYPYSEEGHHIEVPMAVLCNRYTASAAELFASALRDWAQEGYPDKINATLVGTLTYGKGTMQSTIPLQGNTGLKLTVAHYNPPCNVNYDGVGVTPDLEVDLPPEAEGIHVFKLPFELDTQLQAALSLLTE